VLAAASGAWPAVAGAAAVAGIIIGQWWRGARRSASVVAAFDGVAARMGLVRVAETPPVQGEIEPHCEKNLSDS
jgi:hypothetical protein